MSPVYVYVPSQGKRLSYADTLAILGNLLEGCTYSGKERPDISGGVFEYCVKEAGTGILNILHVLADSGMWYMSDTEWDSSVDPGIYYIYLSAEEKTRSAPTEEQEGLLERILHDVPHSTLKRPELGPNAIEYTVIPNSEELVNQLRYLATLGAWEFSTIKWSEYGRPFTYYVYFKRCDDDMTGRKREMDAQMLENALKGRAELHRSVRNDGVIEYMIITTDTYALHTLEKMKEYGRWRVTFEREVPS